MAIYKKYRLLVSTSFSNGSTDRKEARNKRKQFALGGKSLSTIKSLSQINLFSLISVKVSTCRKKN